MVKKKATEQNHLLAAFPAITDRDPRKYQMQLLSSILGGGMSSRAPTFRTAYRGALGAQLSLLKTGKADSKRMRQHIPPFGAIT